ETRGSLDPESASEQHVGRQLIADLAGLEVALEPFTIEAELLGDLHERRKTQARLLFPGGEQRVVELAKLALLAGRDRGSGRGCSSRMNLEREVTNLDAHVGRVLLAQRRNDLGVRLGAVRALVVDELDDHDRRV